MAKTGKKTSLARRKDAVPATAAVTDGGGFDGKTTAMSRLNGKEFYPATVAELSALLKLPAARYARERLRLLLPVS